MKAKRTDLGYYHVMVMFKDCELADSKVETFKRLGVRGERDQVMLSLGHALGHKHLVYILDVKFKVMS